MSLLKEYDCERGRYYSYLHRHTNSCGDLSRQGLHPKGREVQAVSTQKVASLVPVRVREEGRPGYAVQVLVQAAVGRGGSSVDPSEKVWWVLASREAALVAGKNPGDYQLDTVTEEQNKHFIRITIKALYYMDIYM